MAETITLSFYVAVAADETFAVHEDGFDEARELYEENHGDDDQIVAEYQVNLVIPKPSNRQPVVVTAYAGATPEQDRSGSASAFRVNAPKIED